MTFSSFRGPVPVTVLSGFLGAGKTTVLRHLLHNRGEARVAVLLNDMSELNLDAALVGREAALSRTEERLVEMSNGCICCTLREDLLREVRALAEQGRFDAILIESTGISEPVPVAQTFLFEDEDGVSLQSVARLDTMVTVVDAGAFLHDLGSSDRLLDRGIGLSEEDGRSVAGLLVTQVELADVLLLNKVDRVDEAGLAQLHAALKTFNPRAEIVHAVRGQVPWERIVDTGRFDPLQASSTPGWAEELTREHTPETEALGISSVSFEARGPFDAQRLWEVLHDAALLRGVLRAKGLFWLAPDPRIAWEFSLAGGARELSASGLWWAAVPRTRWPHPPGDRPDERPDWDPRFGDRAQQLVFIGQGMDGAQIRRRLEASLLDPTLAAQESTRWAHLPNPFPAPEVPA